MTLKQEIFDFMKGKKKAHLSEIYKSVKSEPSAVRSVLNLSVKNDEKIFLRLGKGEYKLGTATPTERKAKKKPETKKKSKKKAKK